MSAPAKVISRHNNPMVGIGLKLLSVMVLLITSSTIKASEGAAIGQMVFFRSFFGIWPILLLLALRGELVEGFKTSRPLAHFWRGIFAVGGMGLFFLSLTLLPLPEAIAIGYAQPILVVVLGALFLGETVRIHRWSAVLVGLLGVGIIMYPRLTVFGAEGEEGRMAAIGAASAFSAAVFAAFAIMQVRRLVSTERSATIVLYFSITCSLVGLLTIPFGWVALTPTQTALLVLSGIAGGIGQILLTESYRHADMSVIAPFDYSSIIFGIGIGYFIFSEVPTLPTLIGSTIVVGAGLFIIWREHVLGLERRKQAAAATPPV